MDINIKNITFCFIIIITLFVSCKNKRSNISNENQFFIITCDAEKTNKIGDKFVDKETGNYEFNGAAYQTKEEAFSGEYSLKLSPKNRFGFVIDIKNLKAGENFRVKVRIKGDLEGGLVFSDKSNKYYALKKPVAVHTENGWLLIINDFVATDYLAGEELRTYVWYTGNDSIYVDDFTIEYNKEKKYSDKENIPLRIIIDEPEYKILLKKRAEAIKNGILETTDDSWVKALLFYGEDFLPAKIRFKGDWTDHLGGHKWSLRIKLKKGYFWKGMRSFSIQNPKIRAHLMEYIAHEIFRKQDILTTRYGFIPIELNGVEIGIFAYEEHFEKQLLESNNRREGPILKYIDDTFWNSQKLYAKKVILGKTPELEAAGITCFNESRIIKTEALKEQLLTGTDLLHHLKYNTKQAGEIFDIDKLAKYIALTDVFITYHGLVWFNQRFYFNPILNKLEPVLYDAYASKDEFRWATHPILGNLSEAEMKTNRMDRLFMFNLFKDTAFTKKYIHYLHKFSDKTFIDNTIAELQTNIENSSELLRKDNPDYEHDNTYLYESINKIKNKLGTYEKRFLANPNYASSLNTVGINYYNNNIHHEFLPESYIKAYQLNENKIEVHNYYHKNISIIGASKNKGKITENFIKNIKLNRFSTKLPETTVFKVNKDSEHLFFRIKDDPNTYQVTIYPLRPPGKETPQQLVWKDNLFPDKLPEVNLKINQIIFKNKFYHFSKNIIIPKGYKVIFEKGARLNFTDSACLISYSPIFIKGNKENSVVFSSSDKTSMGLVVLQANEKSKINYAVFKNLSALRLGSWVLTSSVNFYESDVEISNSTFESNINCDDALNIIRSVFSIKNCLFSNTFADAFDSDFSTGDLISCTFRKIGNDALDFSGSNVTIDSCRLLEIEDKGISAGEKSSITIKNTTIHKASVGIACKDLSSTELINTEITNCKLAVASFIKKHEYGPAKITGKKVKLKKNTLNYLIEQGSDVNINGFKILDTEKNLANVFY